MSSLLLTLERILEFVLALGVLIFLHEFGHYIFSKIFKIQVEEFGFGFPPRLARLFKIGETEFTLNWIPFGAFVRPKGENDPDVPGGMASASPFARLMILLGGPVSNIVTGLILFSAVFSLAGAPDLTKVEVVSVNASSPAEAAGLREGDLITSVAGVTIDSTQRLAQTVQVNLDQSIEITYLRGDEPLTASLTPRSSPPEGEGAIGIVMTNPVYPVAWIDSIPMAGIATYEQVRVLIETPVRLIRGEVSGDEARFVGPKGMYDIYQIVRTEDRQDDASFPSAAPIRTLSLLATISIALGMTNLLPIPALDGGRILFVLPELIFRKRIPARYENMVHLVGFAALITLMIVITAQDFINPIQLR